MNEGGAECGDGTARDVTSQDPPSPGPLSGEKSFLGDSASVRKREVSSCPPESVSFFSGTCRPFEYLLWKNYV